MYLELTDEQAALQQTLRDYFATVVTPAEAEAMLVTRHGETYREVVKRMGRDGWLGVGWPTRVRRARLRADRAADLRQRGRAT